MRFLTRAECEDWCAQHSIVLRDSGWLRPQFESPEFHRVKLPYDADSGRKVWLARFLYSLVSPAPDALLWIQHFEVWPSAQHMPFFTRFRQALGETRSLGETPGHLVTADDEDDAVSVIVASLFFIFDCYGLASSGDKAFYISHDEYCWFTTRDAEVATRVRVQVSSFETI